MVSVSVYCSIIFIILTQWLSDEDHLENALTDRLAGLYELDRTRDDIDADLHPIDADIKHEHAPTAR